jgi:hypothetical protein
MIERNKLTKEDFEKEGWLVLDNENLTNRAKQRTNEPHWDIHCKGKLCDLFYRSDIARMQITIKGGHISVFHGTCETVEDLRTICRLVDFANPFYDNERKSPL